MALSKEMMGGGVPAGMAQALGGNVNTALASAGSTQADATLVATSTAIVTGADGTTGVILNAAADRRDSQMLVNNSASTLKVYPPVGAALAVPGTGLGTVNASYALTTFAAAIFTRISATQWIVNKSA